MLLWEAIPIWACGCCMGALWGSYTHYTLSYRELVHVAGGCWRLYGSLKGANLEDVKGQDEAVRG